MKQYIYFALAIVGAVGTWYFNLQALEGFFGQMFATPVSSSLTVDIMVAVFAFYIWMWGEVDRLNMNRWWRLGIIPLTGLIAFAFSYPLFLGFRERALMEQGKA